MHVCVGRLNLWCVQLHKGSMFSVADCANVCKYVCLCMDREGISSAIQVCLQKLCVPPWSAAMEMSECVSCACVRADERAVNVLNCDGLGAVI